MNFKKKIIKIIKDCLMIDEKDIVIEVPPENFDDFDYAMPCFRLAKTFKKSPNVLSQEISEKIIDKIINNNILEEVKSFNSYVNFKINKKYFAKKVLCEVFDKKDSFLNINLGKKKKIIFDYSSPNVAKNFHIGHLRSTLIGNVLKNIFLKLGYNCISINHLGDWGTQFGKLITAYELWGKNKKDIDINFLSYLYIKFHTESKNNKNLEKMARDNFMKMQNGDETAIFLWKLFSDISLIEFKKIYKRLNIDFDFYIGESFFNKKIELVINKLKKKKLLIKSDGAHVVDLSDYNISDCLILRSDGGTLYATRDIAAAIYRKKEFNFYKCIYITAFDQSLHFEQFFKVIELMGYKWHKDLIHVSYGLVSLEDGKMSSRHGNFILMQDLLNQAIANTKKIIIEKNPKLLDKNKVSEIVGIGAVIFNNLYNSRIKNIIFSWDKILNFEGETGPYVHYAFVRTCSILKKSNFNFEIKNKNIEIKKIYFNKLTDKYSIRIIKIIDEFKEKIIESSEKLEPHIISRHVMFLAQSFNEFYRENNILNNNDFKIKYARLFLVYCVNIILKIGLEILGIKTCEVM